ncbi:MAG: phytoene/squalene synthase family protein [Pseudomonadota bacterium]
MSADLDHCREAIKHGSRSFYAASKLLPAPVRDPALALYAFCRLADDAVDLQEEKTKAVLDLRDRLDLAYGGRPRNAPTDRAFAAMIEVHEMPRALPEALLEGFAWDAIGKRYDSLSDVRAYSARVAAAVGAMMTVLMGVRDADALARACDLGVAMQLTNIARDVGEDAVEGRIYLPLEWLSEAGLSSDDLLSARQMTPALAGLIQRLLAEAHRLYLRAETGVATLPLGCRPGILAARHIYGGIGVRIAANGYDSLRHRARTTGAQKLGWIARSILQAGAVSVMPRSAVVHAQPLPETAFLVAAAARPGARAGHSRSTALVSVLAHLEAQDRALHAPSALVR